MSARGVEEKEVLVWTDTIWRAFTLSPDINKPNDSDTQTSAVLVLEKRQFEQISLKILQKKCRDERLLPVEAQLGPSLGTERSSEQTGAEASASNQPVTAHTAQQACQTLVVAFSGLARVVNSRAVCMPHAL
ncbi:hypothetical protein PI124_g14915 [Phytophthora idaei]|nr:hypothetical protein PI124_g14915 [Phytophthora idaei]